MLGNQLLLRPQDILAESRGVTQVTHGILLIYMQIMLLVEQYVSSNDAPKLCLGGGSRFESWLGHRLAGGEAV